MDTAFPSTPFFWDLPWYPTEQLRPESLSRRLFWSSKDGGNEKVKLSNYENVLLRPIVLWPPTCPDCAFILPTPERCLELNPSLGERRRYFLFPLSNLRPPPFSSRETFPYTLESLWHSHPKVSDDPLAQWLLSDVQVGVFSSFCASQSPGEPQMLNYCCSRSWVGSENFILSSSQVVLVQGPHFENHWSKSSHS